MDFERDIIQVRLFRIEIFVSLNSSFPNRIEYMVVIADLYRQTRTSGISISDDSQFIYYVK